jgi:hypothetical protein
LLRAAALLSLLCWTAANVMAARPRAARLASTLGLLAVLAHVALAFEERYAWSHALAASDTARETEAVFGASTGLEIFANYAFVLIWAAELLWAWASLPGYLGRPRRVRDASRALFLVMFGSAAIVFAESAWRLLGALAVLVVVAAWYRGDETPRHV